MRERFFRSALYRKHREALLACIDSAIVVFSYFFAYLIRSDFRFPDLDKINIPKYCTFVFAGLAFYNIIFHFLKVHKSLWRYAGANEFIRVVLSGVGVCVVLLPFIVLSNFPHAYASIVVSGSMLTALLMCGIRICYRYLAIHQVNAGIERPNAVIIGAGDDGYVLLKDLQADDEVKVVGYIDEHMKDSVISGCRVLGNISQLAEIVQKYDVSEAYIAMSDASKKVIRDIYDHCQALHLKTKIMRSSDRLMNSVDEKKASLEEISIEDLLGRGEVHLKQDEITSYIQDKVILVSGAGGSIGSELCRQIVRFQPAKLLMVDINENALYMLEQEFLRKKRQGKVSDQIEMKSLIASIRDEKALDEIFTQYAIDVVFHAAAHKHVPLMETRPQEAIKNNVFGTKHMIDVSIRHQVSRFIMISTDKAVNPANAMGASKRMTELILQANGDNGVTRMAAVRFGNVLGSNGSVIPIFQKQIAEGGPVTITDKRIIRYFMTIPEAAQLVLQAGFYADKGDIFVLDMGEPVKILDLAEKMIRMAGLKPYEDIEIVEIGLRPGEKMYEELRLGNEKTTRTKNNLIFRNEAQALRLEELNARLDELSKVLEDCEEVQVRDALMKMIETKEENL